MKDKILVIGFIAVAFLMFTAGTFYDAAINKKIPYQIKLKVSYDAKVSDSITLFDGKRKVGTVALTYGEPFAEMILADNE